MPRLLLSAILAATLTGCVLGDTKCDGPSTGWHKFGDHCYLFQTGTAKRMSYYDAEDFCRTRGAHLASVLSEKEDRFLADTIASHSYYYGRMWIGLNILQGPEKYQWSDGEPFSYKNFIYKKQYKKESCFITYGKEGGWRPEHCGLHYTPICKRAATDVEPSPLPPLVPDVPKGNCPSGWIQFGSKCFKYFGANEADRLKFREALKACMDLGDNHDLASIHSMEEQAFLTQRLYDFGTSAWIGFSYIQSDEIGHDIVFGWTDNSRGNFTYWAPGNPPRGTWKDCTYLNDEGFGKGEWTADYCDLKKRGYICQRQPDASVPEPTKSPSKCDENSVGFKDSCYRYFSTPQNWDQAEATCQKNGGHLVSIHDGYEQNFLYGIIGAKSESLWLGLKNVKDTRIFKWSSGSPLYFSNWRGSQPDISDLQNSCVSTSSAVSAIPLQWDVANCKTEMHFVCETTKATPPPLTDDVVGACPGTDFSWIDIGDNYCYQEGQVSPTESMAWGDISRYCMSKGMEMVSVSSEHQLKLLFSYLWKRSSKYWLGFIRSFDKETFIWTDGNKMNYTNWAETEPSAWLLRYKKDCVAVSMSDLKWYPSGCNEWGGILCKVNKTPAGPRNRVTRSEPNHNKTKVAAPAHDETDQPPVSSGHVSLLVAAVVCMGLSVFVAALIFAWKRRNDPELPVILPVRASESEMSLNENGNTVPKY